VALGRLAPPAPSATPEGGPTATPSGPRQLNGAVHLPVIGSAEPGACPSLLAVQSLGSEPTQVVLLTWGDPGLCPPECWGPLKVTCSGLIQPGRTWFFSAAQIPPGSRSGAVYSFSGRLASEKGLALPGGDAMLGDWLCERLRTDVVGGCDEYRRFKLAYEAGGSFAGLDLARAYGARVAVTVQRRCAADRSPNSVAAAAYEGIQFPDGAPYDAAYGGYSYYMPGAVGRRDGASTLLHVQNTGTACAAVELWFRSEAECLQTKICWQATIAPGETAEFQTADCVAQGWQGTAWLRSTERLAVVADTVGADLLATSGAGATGQDTLLFGPLTGWTSTVSVQNLTPTTTAKVKVTWLDPQGSPIQTLVDWICPRGSRSFALALGDAPTGPVGGSVRVESLPWTLEPNEPAVKPPPISGRVWLLRFADGDPARAIASGVYELLPASATRAGGSRRSGAFGLPLVANDPAGLGLVTQVALANLSDPALAGAAYVQLQIFDENGLVTTECTTVEAGRTVLTGPFTRPGLSPSFRGSGLLDVRAARPDDALEFGAVLLHQATGGPGGDVVSDPVSLELAVPLDELPPAGVPPCTF
jgi:hypothetical protein